MTQRKPSTLTAQVSARVPIDISNFLQSIADKNDRSLSWVVAYALKQWVEGQKRE